MKAGDNIPLVSVIMPVYNAAPYLKQAVQSILNQTFRDFEFIIIDDASTDQSPDIIQSFDDNRIRFIQHATNQKIVKTLNEGIAQARGEYIARMDADDIALPTRLEKQEAFMNAHHDAVVCGTWYEIIGEHSQTIKLPVDADELRYFTLHASPVCHPGVMLRTAILKENNLYYKEEYLYAEDYALWSELLQYGNIYNIPEVLLHYRRNKNSTYTKKKNEIIEAGYSIRKKLIAYLLPELNIPDRDKLADLLTHRRGEASIDRLKEREVFYLYILSIVTHDKDALKKALNKNFIYHLHCSTYLGLPVFNIAITNKLVKPPVKEMVKLFVKYLMRKEP